MLVRLDAVGVTSGTGGISAGAVADGHSKSGGDEGGGLEEVDGRQIPVEDITGLSVLELEDAVTQLTGGNLDGDTTAVGVGQPGVAVEALAGGEGLHLTLGLGDNPKVNGLVHVVQDVEARASGAGGAGDGAGADSAGAGGGAGDGSIGGSGHNGGNAGCAGDAQGGHAGGGDCGGGRGDGGNNRGSLGARRSRRNGKVLDSEGSGGLGDGLASRGGGLVDGLIDGLPDDVLDGLDVRDGDGESSGSSCQKGREADDVEAHFVGLKRIYDPLKESVGRTKSVERESDF